MSRVVLPQGVDPSLYAAYGRPLLRHGKAGGEDIAVFEARRPLTEVTDARRDRIGAGEIADTADVVQPA
jgi:hypothetical protein